MEQKKTNSSQSSIMLVLTALIWGVAFVAQSEGMNYVGGFTFICIRYLLGGLVLIPVISFMRRYHTEKSQAQNTKTGIIGGICCGICLCTASSLQQFGVYYTTVGKAGFITALYIVMIPVFGIFLHKKVKLHIWISVAIATLGMYLLCIKEGFSVRKGDCMVFLCAIGFSIHIMVIDYFSPKAEGVLISCVQFFTASLIGCILMLLFEKPTWNAIRSAWLPLAYTGIMSSGIGYTLQVIAQKNLEPAVASLIMSLESVFSLLAGWVLLGQKLTIKELAGCILVFGAILLAQIPSKA